MSDYIGELEAELIRAGRERQRRRARFVVARPGRRVPRISAAGLMTVLGVSTAIAVALIAIVLAGHRRPQPRTGASAAIPAAARGLVSRLAVLRRPQTAADRALPARVVSTWGSGPNAGSTIVAVLTRLVATVPGRTAPGRPRGEERIFLVVSTPPAGAAKYRGDLVSIVQQVPGGGVTGGVGGLPAAGLSSVGDRIPRPALGYNVAIVPDGIVLVRWDFIDQYGGVTARLLKVHNNVAVAPVVHDENLLTKVVWFGANRRVIETLTVPQNRPLGENLEPPTGTSSRTGGIVLVFKHGTSPRISVTAHGLTPNTKRDAYAVWLYRSPTESKLLGFVNPGVRSDGRLRTTGALPRDAARYTTVLITLETDPKAKSPGKIYLEGKLRLGR